MTDTNEQSSTRPASRRDVLIGAGGVTLGAAAAWGVGALRAAGLQPAADAPFPGTSGAPQSVGHKTGAGAGAFGDAVVDCHGVNQAGIATSPQGFLVLTAFDLAASTDLARMRRLMRLWTEDIERLTTGAATITDTEPELAHLPASLTVTVGFGPTLFDKLGIADKRPSWLAQLPAYPIDQLRDEFTGGDLVVQVCSDDPITATHAARVLAKEAKFFATPRWTQQGSRNAPGVTAPGATMRNHFGQLDGTRNPDPAEEPNLIFRKDSERWLDGGSSMVVRRIHMDLDRWDEIDVPARDIVLGRTQATGAPLTGEKEFDEPDLEARGELGFPIIDVAAHIRRARTDDGSQRILRRPYNYVEIPDAGQISNVGLVFIAFQADLQHQYLPLQAQLAELDLLNQWTTPIGSAVFAIPRGFAPGEVLGEDLFGRE
ncbi:hypothetical protein BSZ39_10850 [Bowdeniella nasicola]|uniref:Dye decolorizing peroxidase n=1 Tax=Bowdeniella nasicola TaxID=208480 RepID=A0A1Q5PZY3_9ACTO|nr:Dyp-type peroxidase [Bowdeniella nasicola]OKL53183.1 hypothetical protein BSZ39_10850 [Bowdeniella nasicola]